MARVVRTIREDLGCFRRRRLCVYGSLPNHEGQCPTWWCDLCEHCRGANAGFSLPVDSTGRHRWPGVSRGYARWDLKPSCHEWRGGGEGLGVRVGCVSSLGMRECVFVRGPIPSPLAWCASFHRRRTAMWLLEESVSGNPVRGAEGERGAPCFAGLKSTRLSTVTHRACIHRRREAGRLWE